MIKSNYEIAFSVKVIHSYFENNVCNCLRFKPGSEMLKLQKRFGFAIQNKTDGFDFYSNSNSLLATLLNHISSSTGITCFDFEIESGNPLFWNFTELPAGPVGQLIFDSQAAANHFDNDSLVLAVNLAKRTGSLPAGKLTIYFDDILKYTTAKGYADFSIRLHARTTQWQYYIINKSAIQFTNPVIKGNADIEFLKPGSVTIPSGEKALLFTSGENLIQLSDIPKYKFTLVDNSSVPGDNSTRRSADRIIFKGLPNPDPGKTGMVNINGHQHVSSPMYVFV